MRTTGNRSHEAVHGDATKGRMEEAEEDSRCTQTDAGREEDCTNVGEDRNSADGLAGSCRYDEEAAVRRGLC